MVPRCRRLDKEVSSQSVHCFADVSQHAYGAVVYAVTTYNDGLVTSRLIASKTKVAPLTATSVPRLELMAAILGLSLSGSIVKALEMEISEVIFWSDNTHVLWWIRRPSKRFKPFVVNRIEEIQENKEPQQWRYVPTKDNPADLLSRGMSTSDLVEDSLWWSGPEFLKTSE